MLSKGQITVTAIFLNVVASASCSLQAPRNGSFGQFLSGKKKKLKPQPASRPIFFLVDFLLYFDISNPITVFFMTYFGLCFLLIN